MTERDKSRYTEGSINIGGRIVKRNWGARRPQPRALNTPQAVASRSSEAAGQRGRTSRAENLLRLFKVLQTECSGRCSQHIGCTLLTREKRKRKQTPVRVNILPSIPTVPIEDRGPEHLDT
ncbi:hypothetical protein EVAR_60843_1 [Eumeta japonica]|uniref:Uncharacterized protein n=1 Tax=Eumeta variegata TaxID=151549 RepID=A0A4C1Y5T4_EUMVA|nr:hypothetical protein EVAR_60843_1 [Eumeta japonica]